MKRLKITWIGHSCFKIESNGFSIILDPYSDGSVPGYSPVREKANMVLCSHGHGDHNAVQCVEIEEKRDSAISIARIETFHDDKQGSLRGKNTIHIIDDGTFRIAHLGDLGCALDAKQIKLLSGLDAVMMPVGGYYTIDARQAEKIVDQIKPKMVIPMHYRGEDNAKPAFGYDVLDEVSSFLEDFDSVKTMAGSSVDTKDIPAQIVVLQPQNYKA